MAKKSGRIKSECLRIYKAEFAYVCQLQKNMYYVGGVKCIHVKQITKHETFYQIVSMQIVIESNVSLTPTLTLA